MTVVFPHPFFPKTSPRTFRGTVAVAAGLPGILFVDIHSCSTLASGIHELNALL